ncbi:MAG: hypothetical protein HQL40_05415 [Alphaproteobacteria bacterium]|nr:hypothetical protein [Alphaproteobacteria bacterium]
MPMVERSRPEIDVDALKTRLAVWQTPQAMRAEVDDIRSATLFNRGGLAFLRDAWIAAEFGAIRKAEEVRIVSDAWPDFELRLDGCDEKFEAVEAIDPERRRGDEYREGRPKVMEDWLARVEQAPEWLRDACRKKAGKGYDNRTKSVSLVIYFNFSEFGMRQSEFETCFPSATIAVKDVFKSVWILWKNKAYRIWS